MFETSLCSFNSFIFQLFNEKLTDTVPITNSGAEFSGAEKSYGILTNIGALSLTSLKITVKV